MSNGDRCGVIEFFGRGKLPRSDVGGIFRLPAKIGQKMENYGRF